MVNRRRLLIGVGISALTCGAGLYKTEARQDDQVPPGGTPSIGDDGVVEFTYPDGTRIQVYDNRIVISKPGAPNQEKPRFPIDTQALEMPAIPNDPVLKTWLASHAKDLRGTIGALLRHDPDSTGKYDAYERGLSLTVYKSILVRHKYIRRLTRTE